MDKANVSRAGSETVHTHRDSQRKLFLCCTVSSISSGPLLMQIELMDEGGRGVCFPLMQSVAVCC